MALVTDGQALQHWRTSVYIQKDGRSDMDIDAPLKGLTQLWKNRRIYPKYMPKCSVGSTDHVCKFLLKKIA